MESTDKLDEFVELNREQFDCFEPSPDLWNKIEVQQSTNKKKLRLLRSFMKVAAAIVILLGTYITINKGFTGKNDLIALQTDSISNIQIAEYKEAQQFYSSELTAKMNTLKERAKNYPEFLKEVNTELHALDNEFKSLQHDLQDCVENKEVVSAMIQNYKFKLEIIEKINEVITEQEAQKKALHHEV